MKSDSLPEKESTKSGLTLPYFNRRYDIDDVDRLHELGANDVIFCVREEHLDESDSQLKMRETVARARKLGMGTEIDFWGFGNICGGEARSKYGPERPACYDDAEFQGDMRRALNFAASLSPDGIFWDEIHFKDCFDCQNKNEVRLIKKFAYLASSEFGLKNSVCLTSSSEKLKTLDSLAAEPYIHQIETDPYYTNYPGDSGGDTHDYYVGDYAARLGQIASRRSVSSRLWVQGFGMEDGWESVPVGAAEAAIKKGIRQIGFWGCQNWQAAEMDFGFPDIVPVNNDQVLAAVPKINHMLAGARKKDNKYSVEPVNISV